MDKVLLEKWKEIYKKACEERDNVIDRAYNDDLSVDRDMVVDTARWLVDLMEDFDEVIEESYHEQS